MKYCEHCGKSISEDSRFCNYCGSPVFNEYNIKYYLAIVVSEKRSKLSSFYDSLYANCVNFSIIDANAVRYHKNEILDNILHDYINQEDLFLDDDFSNNRNIALLINNDGHVAGEFSLETEYARFRVLHFLIDAPFQILPIEMLGKSENVRTKYLIEKNNKRTLSLEITDCYEDHDHPVGSEVVKSIKEQLDKHGIVNYSVNTLWIEELEYLRDDCEYGIYRPHQVSVGAIALYDGFRVLYGANSSMMLDFDTRPFRVPELIMALKNPYYKIKQPLEKHEKAERNEHDFLYNKYFMFINITTDRAVNIKEENVDEDNYHMWPRLASISWIVSDCEGNIKDEYITKRIILRDSKGKVINSEGYISVHSALKDLYNNINPRYFTLVGHNVELIKKVIMAECYEMKKQETFYIEDEYYWFEDLITTMKEVKSICTMTPIISLLKEHDPDGQFESIDLEPAYSQLFREKKLPYHDYAISTYNCYSKLLNMGLVENPYSDIIELRNS